jgi:hypothetical protein
MKFAVGLFMMLLYVVTGGLYICDTVTEFKKGHYFRFGVALMFALSMVICMTKLVFIW